VVSAILCRQGLESYVMPKKRRSHRRSRCLCRAPPSQPRGRRWLARRVISSAFRVTAPPMIVNDICHFMLVMEEMSMERGF